jgi:phosphoglycerate dehydrogenase-like enzyme
MDNVLIQPHISAASPHYLELFVEELAEKINNLKKKNIEIKESGKVIL